MAGASDKARFYLEQSVPELQELAHKKIFTCDEINSIIKKRSDFEHILNARGSQPSDYARYAEYEMNLESLRRKRVKRLGVKSTNHTGQRRIFFVLERATNKFPGDVGLWMQYLAFARKQGASKKVSQILTSVLRLHPTKGELWIYAANYAVEERDVMEAREYMQRGLRFCKGYERIWIEYARLEMIWVAKILGRRKVLGLDQTKEGTEVAGEDGNGDEITLPVITEEDIAPPRPLGDGLDQDALKRLQDSPALSGAIPVAIFDAAMKQFGNNDEFALHFFDTVAEFSGLSCTHKILEHILDSLRTLAPRSLELMIRWIQEPVIGVDAMSSKFPSKLGLCIERIDACIGKLDPRADSGLRAMLGQRVIRWVLPFLGIDDLDPDIRKVIRMTIRKAWNQLKADIEHTPPARAVDVAEIIREFEAQGLHKISEPARAWAMHQWPSEAQLFSRDAQNHSYKLSIA